MIHCYFSTKILHFITLGWKQLHQRFVSNNIYKKQTVKWKSNPLALEFSVFVQSLAVAKYAHITPHFSIMIDYIFLVLFSFVQRTKICVSRDSGSMEIEEKRRNWISWRSQKFDIWVSYYWNELKGNYLRVRRVNLAFSWNISLNLLLTLSG